MTSRFVFVSTCDERFDGQCPLSPDLFESGEFFFSVHFDWYYLNKDSVLSFFSLSLSLSCSGSDVSVE